MTNTLVLLAVLGIVNFLIKKFAKKPDAPESGIDVKALSAEQGMSRTQETLSKPAPRNLEQFLRAQLFSAPPVAPTPSALPTFDRASARTQTPVRVKRSSQRPIMVTDAPKPAVRAAMKVATLETAQEVNQILTTTSIIKPISAIDALIAKRTMHRIAPIGARQIRATNQGNWSARSLRQGVLMAEILSPPIALR